MAYSESLMANCKKTKIAKQNILKLKFFFCSLKTKYHIKEEKLEETVFLNLPENITTAKALRAFEKAGKQMRSIKTGDWKIEISENGTGTISTISHSDIVFYLFREKVQKSRQIRVLVKQINKLESISLIQFFRIFMIAHCAS